MINTLDNIMLNLAQHCRDRCGAGFGNYPVGVRYALTQLLPLIDQDRRGRNGYDQPTASIRELVAEIDERLSK
mgnify:CR=1 FL=1